MSARSTCAAVFAVAVMGASLAACGGGGSSGLSESALATKANSICNTFNQKADAVPSPKDFTVAAQASAYFDQLIPIITQGQNELAALKPDSDAKADWDAFVAAEGKTLTLLKDVDAKAKVSDASGLEDLKNQEPAIEASIKSTATKVGATDCGQ